MSYTTDQIRNIDAHFQRILKVLKYPLFFGRLKFFSGDPLGGTLEEIKEAFEGFYAYCGTYEVNAEKRTVTHHLKASGFPNWEGTDQLRYFEFSGTRLILKTEPIPALGTEWIVSLIWEQMA